MQPITLTEAVDVLQTWQNGSPSRRVDLHPNPVLGGYTAAALSREAHLAVPENGWALVWEFRADTLEEAITKLGEEVRTQLALDFDGYISRDNEEDPLPEPRPVEQRQIITYADVRTGTPFARVVMPAGAQLGASERQGLAFYLMAISGMPLDVTWNAEEP